MDKPGFEGWLRETTPESFEDGAFISHGWLRWLNQVYELDGPLSREALEERGLADMSAAAQHGVDIVLDDVERVPGQRPHMELTDKDGLRVGYLSDDGISYDPPEGLSTPDEAEVLVEVATRSSPCWQKNTGRFRSSAPSMTLDCTLGSPRVSPSGRAAAMAGTMSLTSGSSGRGLPDRPGSEADSDRSAGALGGPSCPRTNSPRCGSSTTSGPGSTGRTLGMSTGSSS